MFPSPARQTFRYTIAWCIAAALPFLALLAWGAYDFYESRSLDPALWLFIGIFALLFPSAWLWTKTRVTLDEEGVSYKSPFTQTDLRWNQITYTRYRQQQINVALPFGPIGSLVATAPRTRER